MVLLELLRNIKQISGLSVYAFFYNPNYHGLYLLSSHL